MACDPATLVNAATCFENCFPPGMELPVMIYLAAQIAGVDVSNQSAINALMGKASCMTCIPVGMQWPALIGIACQIAGV